MFSAFGLNGLYTKVVQLLLILEVMVRRRNAKAKREQAVAGAGDNSAGRSSSKNATTPYLQLGSESPTALVVVIHGIYMDAAWMEPFAHKLARALPHVRFLVPEQPEENGGKWFMEPSGPPNPPGIQAPRAQIVEEINKLREQYAIPLSRVVLVGFSMGTSMAGYVAREFYPDACGGLVLLSGGSQYKNLAKSEAVRTNTHVLLTMMSRDEGCLNENLPKLRDAMRSRGLQVDFREYEGRHLDAIKLPESIGAVTDFLRNRIPPTASSPKDWSCKRASAPMATGTHEAAVADKLIEVDMYSE
jgi:predicted esterase